MKGEQRQELSLRDMIYKVLCSWRLMIVWALVVAFLLTGVKFLMDMRSYSQATAQSEAVLQNPEEILTDAQLLAVEEAEALREQISHKEEYSENSLYFAIDPYSEHLLSLIYYVETDGHIDFSNGIISGDGGELSKAYANCINNNLFSEYNDEQKTYYYRELVRVAYIDSSSYQFSIVIKGATKDQVYELAEKVKALVASVEKDLSSSLESHTLHLLNESYAVTVDNDLMAKKEQHNLSLTTAKKSLNALITTFNATQSQLFNATAITPPEEEPAPSRPGVSVKYFVLGAFLGVVGGAVYVVLSYMMGSRLKKQEDLAELYDLATLGTLTSSRKKKCFGFVDRLIEKWFTRERWTPRQRTAFTLSNLRILCEKHNISSLALITNLPLSKHEKALVDQIANELKQHSVEVFLGEHIHKDPEAYEKARACSFAVLLEKEDVSYYPDIERELTLCQQADITVLGAVTFVQ